MKKLLVFALIIPVLLTLPACMNSECRVKKSCPLGEYHLSQENEHQEQKS